MYIRGPGLHRLGHDGIDHADDGGVVFDFIHRAYLEGGGFFILAQFPQKLLHFAVKTQAGELLYGQVHLFLADDDGQYVQAGIDAHIIDGFIVQGIHHGQGDAPVFGFHRQNPVLADHMGGQQYHRFLGDVQLGQDHIGYPQNIFQYLQELMLVDYAPADQNPPQLVPGLLLILQGRFQLLRSDEPVFQQFFTKSNPFHRRFTSLSPNQAVLILLYLVPQCGLINLPKSARGR